MDMVKKNLKAIIAAFLGLFHWVLLAIPFLCAFYEVLGKTQYEKNVSGYQCFGEAVEAAKAGGFLKFALVVFMIAAIAMLLIGAYLLVRAFMGDKINLPESFGNLSVDKLCSWVYIAYAAGGLLTYVAAGSVGIANSTFEETLGISAGFSIGFGVTLSGLLAVVSLLALWLVTKKFNAQNAGDMAFGAHFACEQCGETAKKGTAFCPKCGGKVVEVIPAKPMCTVCGTPAKKGDAFCPKCGGKVEEVVPTRPVCEVCGAPGKNGAAFCSQCGGKIVQK